MSDRSRLRRYAARLLLACIGLMGVMSLPALSLHSAAHRPVPVVEVALHDPGNDPGGIAQQLVRPLEVALQHIAGVAGIDTRLVGDRAWMTLRLSPGAGKRSVLREVRQALSEVALPASAAYPQVSYRVPSQRLAWRILGTAADEPFMAWATANLLSPLGALPAVESVRLEGGPQREIEIWPDMRRLAAAGFTLLDVVDVVGHETNMRAREPENVALAVDAMLPRLASLPLRFPNGETAPLSGFATLRAVVSAPEATQTPRLVVQVRPETNVQAAAQQVSAHVAWLSANGQLPAGVTLAADAAYQPAIAPSRQAATAFVLAIACLGALAVALIAGARAAGAMMTMTVLSLLLAVPTGIFLGHAVTAVSLLAVVLATGLCGNFVMSGWRVRMGQTLAITGLAVGATVLAATWLDRTLAAREFAISAAISSAAAIVVSMLWYLASWSRNVEPRPLLARLLGRIPRPALTPRAWRVVMAALFLISAGIVLSCPGAGEPGEKLQLRLYAEDIDLLTREAEQLRNQLAGEQLLIAMDDPVGNQRPQWFVNHLEAGSPEQGAQTTELARLVRIALDEPVIAELRDGRQTLPVRLRLGYAALDVPRLVVSGERQDRPVRLLRDIARAEQHTVPAELRRDLRGQYVEIAGEMTGAMPAELAVERIRALSASAAIGSEIMLSGSIAPFAGLRVSALGALLMGTAFFTGLAWYFFGGARAAADALLGMMAPWLGVALLGAGMGAMPTQAWIGLALAILAGWLTATSPDAGDAGVRQSGAALLWVAALLPLLLLSGSAQGWAAPVAINALAGCCSLLLAMLLRPASIMAAHSRGEGTS